VAANCTARAGNGAIRIETAGYQDGPAILGGAAMLMCAAQARDEFK